MARNGTLTVRLSRIVIFLFLIAGVFFFMAGMEIGFLHRIIPAFSIAKDKQFIYILFLVFFIGIGGVTTLQMLWYLVFPPALFTASEKGVSFATGLRYRQYLLPWKFVETITVGADITAVALNRQGAAGLQVTFKNDPSIPAGLATSMGVFYMAYTMTLSFFYMDNKNIPDIKRTLEEMKQLYS